jgi:hypothetical protein
MYMIAQSDAAQGRPSLFHFCENVFTLLAGVPLRKSEGSVPSERCSGPEL